MGVKVDTNLPDHGPLELHPTRGCDQTRECKDGAEEGLEKRKKRESFTFTLLDAYNVAINMDTRKREGRPTQGTPPAEVPAPPSDGPSSPSPTKASPAPPTLEGTAKEEPGITPWVGRNKTSLYLSHLAVAVYYHAL